MVMLLSMLLLALQQGTSGSVEIVVRDVNTREPIAGVPVTLTFKFPTEPAGDSVTIATDPRGVSNFGPLAPGNYLIRLADDGFDTRSLRDHVLVDPGDRQRIDLLVKRTASVRGRVLTSEGKPSEGVLVTLHSTTYLNMRRALENVGRATTNAQGRFEFTLIPFGDYYVRIENQAPQWGFAYYPDESDLTAARTVPIRARDVPLGDIKMPRLPRFKVSGVVTYPGANTNRAVRLSLAREYPTIFEESRYSSSLPLAPAGPNEARFELEGLTRGTWVLSMAVPEAGVLARETIVIVDRNLQDIRVVLKPPIEIRGKVVMRDSQSRLPESLRVTSRARELIPTNLLTGFSREPVISPSGDFVVGNLMEGGRYGLSVGPLPVNAFLADIRWGARSILHEDSFIAGAFQEVFEIHIASLGGIIKGVVRDTAGQFVPSAHITVVPEFWLRKNPLLYKRSTADARGQFVIQGLAPGEYQVFAWPAPPPLAADQDPAFLGLFESRSTRVKAAPGLAVETTLRLMD